MKKRTTLISVLAVLAFALVSAAPVAAQTTTSPSDDQEIEALKKRQAELKRQIREELQKQNKALEEELNTLRGNSAKQPSTTSAPTTSTSTSSNPPSSPRSNGTIPAVTTSGGTSSNGGGSDSTTPPAVSRPLNLTTAASPQPASGQESSCAVILATPNDYSRAERDICGLAQAIVDRRIANLTLPVGARLSTGVDTTREDLGFLMTVVLAQRIRANLAVDAAVKSLVVDVESGRNDKQLGADPKASGTTSLGVKGGIPQVLSWGVENGATVASRDGTTVTFRINPVGFVQALAGQGYISGFTKTENDPLAQFFRRTSIGFSFDTTRGTDPPTLIGSKQQLSAVSFRYQFINRRDPRESIYRQKWDEFFRTEGLAFTARQTEQFMRIQSGTVEGALKNAVLQRWVTDTNTSLRATTTVATDLTKNTAMDEVRRIIQAQLQNLPASELDKDPELIDAITKLIGAYAPYLTKKKELMDEISKGTLVTFEYTNFREPNAPDLSNLRFIAEKGTLGGLDFTANASLTFFNKRPTGPGMQRIRDFDFSAQLDKRLDDVMGLGPATLSFTGKYQRLTSNAVAFDGTVLPNTKGDIAAGQVKLTIPIKDSGIKIPFSWTFANRTELVRERENRGNFGFTFDLDTLFARFKSFAQ